MVVEWKVESREGKGGEPVEGRGQWVLFPSMFPSQLCNEGAICSRSGRRPRSRHSETESLNADPYFKMLNVICFVLRIPLEENLIWPFPQQRKI